MWGKEKLFLSDCENHRRSTSNVDSCSKNGRTNDDEKVTLQVQNHAVGNIAGTSILLCTDQRICLARL